MKQIRLLFFLICFFMILTLLCSCSLYRSGSFGAAELDEAYYILNDCTPFLSTHIIEDASHWDNAEVLDTDEYGRRLIRYCGRSPYLAVPINWDISATCLLICQKVSGGFAYYYDDICWVGKSIIAEKQLYAEFSEDEVDALKERNDWGLPLENDKMQRVCYTVPLKTPDGTGLEENVFSYLGLSSEQTTALGAWYLKKNDAGVQFVWYMIEGKHYFCLVDPTDNSVLACELYEGDPLQCQDAVHEFKEKNGFYE